MTWTCIAGVYTYNMRLATFLVSLLAVASAAQIQPAGSIVNAANNGDLAAVQEMLADPALSTETITEALKSAAIAGHRRIVKVLLQDTRSNPGVAIRPVFNARGMDNITTLINWLCFFGGLDWAQLQRLNLSRTDEEQLDILTFRFSHDPAILECLTECQLTRVQVPSVVQSAFLRAIYNLSGHPVTIDGYRQLMHDVHGEQIKTMMILAHLFASSSPLSFLISDVVRLIGK